MAHCARCGKFACLEELPAKVPTDCPMGEDATIYEESLAEYKKPEIRNIARNAAIVEAVGYGVWTRLEEIIEFAWRAGFKKLGFAFCLGLRKEGAKVEKILRKAGFEVESAACKTGGRPKELLGIKENEKVHPGQFEVDVQPHCPGKTPQQGKDRFSTSSWDCAWGMIRCFLGIRKRLLRCSP